MIEANDGAGSNSNVFDDDRHSLHEFCREPPTVISWTPRGLQTTVWVTLFYAITSPFAYATLIEDGSKDEGTDLNDS
jgi:hypothetical protein